MLLPLVVFASCGYLARRRLSGSMTSRLVVTVVTGFDYLFSAIRMRRRVRKERAGSADPAREPDHD